jgi:hypothetical protein
MCACGGGVTGPSAPPLPLFAETAHFRFYAEAGDRIDTNWEEQYHAWATAQLGLTLTQKITYNKYTSRPDMGDHTGNYSSNGFAQPDTLTLYTLWPTDNHEVVHLYTSQFGRTPGLFNEGIAVAFQVDPVAGDFVTRFNGVAVDDACRTYFQAGTLLLPLSRIAQTSDWVGLTDSVLAYREAGSFMRFLLDTYGVDRVLQFFRMSTTDDPLPAIDAHLVQAVGRSLEQLEAEWLRYLGA